MLIAEKPSHINLSADSYGNNATTVALSVDLLPEAIRTAEFYGADGSKLNVTRRGHVSLGRTTILKFAVSDVLPARGRIVLNIYDQLEKRRFDFKVVAISLTGQPM